MRRLYRSRTEAMIGGVCGGLGEYLAIDPTIIRLFFVFLGLAGGSGLLLYILLWIIIPIAPEEAVPAGGAPSEESPSAAERRTGLFFGAVLVVLGLIFLLRNLSCFWWAWFDRCFWGVFHRALWPVLSVFSRVIWPLLLIGAGLILLLRRGKGG
ncbi:MAG: PspC domain-containing protein [Bacillota bacterium]